MKGTQVPVEELQSLVADKKALMKVRQMKINCLSLLDAINCCFSSSHFRDPVFANYYIFHVYATFIIDVTSPPSGRD